MKTSEQLWKWRWGKAPYKGRQKLRWKDTVRKDLKAWNIREEWERWKGLCKTRYTAQGDAGERWKTSLFHLQPGESVSPPKMTVIGWVLALTGTDSLIRRLPASWWSSWRSAVYKSSPPRCHMWSDGTQRRPSPVRYGRLGRRPARQSLGSSSDHLGERYLTFNLYGLESHLIPLCMGYQDLQNYFWSWCCNPVTRIQDGRQNETDRNKIVEELQ